MLHSFPIPIMVSCPAFTDAAMSPAMINMSLLRSKKTHYEEHYQLGHCMAIRKENWQFDLGWEI